MSLHAQPLRHGTAYNRLTKKRPQDTKIISYENDYDDDTPFDTHLSSLAFSVSDGFDNIAEQYQMSWHTV